MRNPLTRLSLGRVVVVFDCGILTVESRQFGSRLRPKVAKGSRLPECRQELLSRYGFAR